MPSDRPKLGLRKSSRDNCTEGNKFRNRNPCEMRITSDAAQTHNALCRSVKCEVYLQCVEDLRIVFKLVETFLALRLVRKHRTTLLRSAGIRIA